MYDVYIIMYYGIRVLSIIYRYDVRAVHADRVPTYISCEE
jgi:hypothetical protein